MNFDVIFQDIVHLLCYFLGKISSSAGFAELKQKRKLELDYLKNKNAINVEHTKALAEIESNKFKAMVKAIGPQTLQ